MRDFEKISFEQFSKDVAKDRNLYDSIKIPQRDSDATAGYDIYLLNDVTLKPNEIVQLPTGLKCYFAKDEVLLLIVRSSTGFRYNVRLCNQVGVIDADYYNNKDNEGHLLIKIQNQSDKEVFFPKGESIVQSLFLKYLTTESDKKLNIERGCDY